MSLPSDQSAAPKASNASEVTPAQDESQEMIAVVSDFPLHFSLWMF